MGVTLEDNEDFRMDTGVADAGAIATVVGGLVGVLLLAWVGAKL